MGNERRAATFKIHHFPFPIFQIHPTEAYAWESPTVHGARGSTGASSLPHIFPGDGNREEAPVLFLLLDLASQTPVTRDSVG
jgi:hypothetical protein